MSGKSDEVYKYFGFDCEKISNKIINFLKKSLTYEVCKLCKTALQKGGKDLSIKDELNNNKVKSAYGDIKNSSSVNNSKLLSKTNDSNVNTYKNYKSLNTRDFSSNKKKIKSLASIVKSFALIVSASIMGAIGISTMTSSTIVADKLYVEAYDTGVYYYCTLSDFDDNITVELKNDFTNRIEKVRDIYIDGCFDNLATNMKYTFVIKHGSKIIAQKEVVTKSGRNNSQNQYDWNDKENYYGRENDFDYEDDYDYEDDDYDYKDNFDDYYDEYYKDEEP